MPTFTYTGITAAGQQIDGVVEAFDEIEAMERAREQCRVVQSVVPVREGKNLLSMDITKPKAKQKNLAVMCAQFATILNAGAHNQALRQTPEIKLLLPNPIWIQNRLLEEYLSTIVTQL